MILAVVFLILSYVYAIRVSARKRIPLASNFSIFFTFSIIYSVFPVLIYYGIEPKIWFHHFSLNESELLVGTQTAIIAACNFIFALVFDLKYNSKKDSSDRSLPPLPSGVWKGLIWIGYMVASLILIYAGHKFNYTSTRGEMVRSVISNAKVLLAALYIVFLVCYGFTFETAIMFLAFAVMLMVEQSRWYFFSVLVATAFYLQNTRKINGKQIVIGALAFAMLLSFVGLYRCHVDIEDFSLFLNPFYIEGDYGSYVNLQTYDLIYRRRIAFYTYFSDYVADPILYLTPRPFFMGLGLDKEKVGIHSAFVEAHQPCLAEKFAPVGGFHYISQASSGIPFAGPLILTFLFAVVTVRAEKGISKSKLKELSYYLFSSGFMFVFIKTRFDQTVKYYLTLAVPAFIIYAIITARRSVPREDT